MKNFHEFILNNGFSRCSNKSTRSLNLNNNKNLVNGPKTINFINGEKSVWCEGWTLGFCV
jgi:hypothetical protein